METNELSSTITKKHTHSTRVYVLIGCGVALFSLVYLFIAAPLGSVPTTIHISKDESVQMIAGELYAKHTIRHPFIFEKLVSIFGGSSHISLGDYYIEQGTPVWKVSYNIARGVHNIVPIKVTFPEGSTNEQMSHILSLRMPQFDTNLFLQETGDLQGYLFPDTYFFYPLSTVDEIVDALHGTAKVRIKKDIASTPLANRSSKEIVNMASIVQKEAKDANDSPLIAGILWKRISLGMPLQVDAAPDTYKIKGLPIHPIANAGDVALHAAAFPVSSSYLYYLHDKNGMVHFATTYREHRANIARYLK